jgi:L-lactate dehydrogenase complex protein LldG
VSSREEVLDRIRAALAVDPDTDVPIPRQYLRRQPNGDLTDLFAERLSDYTAAVSRTGLPDVPAAIAAAVARLGLTEVAVAPGFPAAWLPVDANIAWRTDDPPLSPAELDGCGAALTTAAAAIALTGTIVLDSGPGQGRRALSLVPDVHLCVLRAGQIAADVPDTLARLDPVRPLTFISGPSATSDIELERVEGVHGPRTLHVIIAEGGSR